MIVAEETRTKFEEFYLAKNGCYPDYTDPMTSSALSAYLAGWLDRSEEDRIAVALVLPESGRPTVVVNGLPISFTGPSDFYNFEITTQVLEAAGVMFDASEESAVTVAAYLNDNPHIERF